MSFYKFVDSLDKIEKTSFSIYKLSHDSYVVNNGLEIFSCLAKVSYQVGYDKKKNDEKIEIVFTCTNRNFVQVIR